MFNPAESVAIQLGVIFHLLTLNHRESEADWDKELASDVKEECQSYGKVDHIKVERDSQVMIPSQPVAMRCSFSSVG